MVPPSLLVEASQFAREIRGCRDLRLTRYRSRGECRWPVHHTRNRSWVVVVDTPAHGYGNAGRGQS